MKTCIKCNEDKSFEDFPIRSTNGKMRSECRVCTKLSSLARYEANKEKILDRTNNYYHENKDKYVEWNKDWSKNNRAQKRLTGAMSQAARKARLRKQSPELTTDEAQLVRDLYWLAKDLYAVSGQEYHVDHIIPIAKGGLHHPDNLQILPADINQSKGDRIL